MRTGYSKGYIAAALVAVSLAAAPLVMSAGKALATSGRADTVAEVVTIAPVAVTPVAVPPAIETCTRKVRVVYSGYGSASACR